MPKKLRRSSPSAGGEVSTSILANANMPKAWGLVVQPDIEDEGNPEGVGEISVIHSFVATSNDALDVLAASAQGASQGAVFTGEMTKAYGNGLEEWEINDPTFVLRGIAHAAADELDKRKIPYSGSGIDQDRFVRSITSAPDILRAKKDLWLPSLILIQKQVSKPDEIIDAKDLQPYVPGYEDAATG
jgi:hypothetical protein